MLEIHIAEKEFYIEETNKIVLVPPSTVHLEHSLLSVSKWEAKYSRAFLGPQEKTTAELQDYIQFMCLEPLDPGGFLALLQQHRHTIMEYITSGQTATTFHEMAGNAVTRETITSELVYYWMTVHNIPFTCETWHLNRLITLVRVCNLKAQPAKKQSRSSMVAQRNRLNAARRQSSNSRG